MGLVPVHWLLVLLVVGWSSAQFVHGSPVDLSDQLEYVEQGGTQQSSNSTLSQGCGTKDVPAERHLASSAAFTVDTDAYRRVSPEPPMRCVSPHSTSMEINCTIIEVLQIGWFEYAPPEYMGPAYATACLYYGTQYFLDVVNREQKMLPGYWIIPYWLDDKYDAILGMQVFEQTMREFPNRFIGLSYGADPNIAYYGIRSSVLNFPYTGAHLGSMGSNKDVVPFYFRTNVNMIDCALPMAKIYQLLNFSLSGITYEDSYKEDAFPLAGRLQAKGVDMAFSTYITTIEEDLKGLANALAEARVRVLIVLGPSPVKRSLLCHMIRKGFDGIIYLSPTPMYNNLNPVSGYEDICTTAALTEAVRYSIVTLPGMYSMRPTKDWTCTSELSTVSVWAWWNEFRQTLKHVTIPALITPPMDNMCLWILMLRHFFAKGVTLDTILARGDDMYADIKAFFHNVSFVGGKAHYKFKESGDPISSFILSQFIDKVIPLGSYMELTNSFYNTSGVPVQIGTLLTWPFAGVVEATYPECEPGYQSGHQGNYGPCQPCAPGFRAHMSTLYNNWKCDACDPGWMQPLEGQETCVRCSKGSFSLEAAAQCTLCPAGKIADSDGLDVCLPCGAGLYAANKGSSACSRCPKGFFSPERGSTNCTTCKVLAPFMTTDVEAATSLDDCHCPAGMYDGGGYPQRCFACPPGMECSFGSTVEALSGNASEIRGLLPPMVKPGHYSKIDEPLSVYLCYDSRDCPGGLPGQCNKGLSHLVCSGCPSGQVMKDDECAPCATGNYMITILLIPLGIAALIITYYFGNSPVTSNASLYLGVSITGGMVITSAQIMAMLRRLSAQWPASVDTSFESVEFLMFDPKTIDAECMSGNAPIQQFTARFSGPYAIAIVMSSIWAATQFIPRFAWNLDKTFNATGQIFQTLFIALAAIVAIPFQCYTHPNGKQSVVKFSEILCWTEDHNGLVALAIILAVTFVLPFLAVCIRADYVMLPASKSLELSKKYSPNLLRFRFLYYRYRPDVWWWGIAFFVRQLLLAFAPMVRPDDAYAQLLYTASVLMVYVTFQAYLQPWKTRELNYLDSAVCALLALLLMVEGAFMDATPWAESYETIMMTLVVAVFAVLSSVIVYCCCLFFQHGLDSEFGRQYPSNRTPETLAHEWHVMGCKIQRMSTDELTNLTKRMNGYDRATIDSSIGCFQAAALTPKLWITDKSVPRILQATNAIKKLEEEWSDLKETIQSRKSDGGSTESAQETLYHPPREDTVSTSFTNSTEKLDGECANLQPDQLRPKCTPAPALFEDALSSLSIFSLSGPEGLESHPHPTCLRAT